MYCFYETYGQIFRYGRLRNEPLIMQICMPDLQISGFLAPFQMKVWATTPAKQAMTEQTQRLT